MRERKLESGREKKLCKTYWIVETGLCNIMNHADSIFRANQVKQSYPGAYITTCIITVIKLVAEKTGSFRQWH